MPTRDVSEIEIPDDIQALLDGFDDEKESSNPDKLDAIGKALGQKKADAVAFREMSGIEDVWRYCEDAYAGIDDANRAEFTNGRMIKALTLGAPLQTDTLKKDSRDRKSTAFVRLTSRYVDSGSAKVGEILLPINDKAFSFTATPIPDLVKGLNDLSQVTEVINGQQVGLKRPARKDELASGSPEQVPLTHKDMAEEAIAKANEKAKKAETRIFDWQIECQHHKEMRKVIFDAARLGVGVAKGPFPANRRAMVITKDKDGKPVLTINQKIVPVDKWISPWNFYPDPACGEDIHNGDHCFERDFFSEKQIRDLKGLPGYISDQIDKVIEGGPTKTKSQTKNPADTQSENKHPYEIWFYHGSMKREDFEAVNPKAAKTLDAKQDLVHAVVTMVNDIVIRGSINPLDSGELIYDAVPWVRRPGSWAGVGVGEQIMVPQRIVNAATRALLNNAGITSGPQIVINRKLIEPGTPGDYTLVPNKIWYLTEDGMTDDVRKAFLSFDIHNTGDPLGKIIEYGMRLAEESTNIPLITQGLSGKTQPETFGATQLQDNNANQLLRNIGYGFDDFHTVPMINRYYEYLMLDPEVPDDEKGDYQINAHGSIALVERSIQDQFIGQLTPAAQNPAFGINPKRWMKSLLKSRHLDPELIMYTPEEQDKIDSQPPPQAPAVQVAMIKAKTDQMKMQLEQQRNQEEDALARELAQIDAKIQQHASELQNQTAQLRIKVDTDRDTVYAQTEAQRAQAEFQQKLQELQLKKDLAMMDYASKHQLTLEQTKAKLADTAMKLQVQKELAAMDTHAALHMHHTPSAEALLKPPTQTPGKAPNGKAFSQV